MGTRSSVFATDPKGRRTRAQDVHTATGSTSIDQWLETARSWMNGMRGASGLDSVLRSSRARYEPQLKRLMDQIAAAEARAMPSHDRTLLLVKLEEVHQQLVALETYWRADVVTLSKPNALAPSEAHRRVELQLDSLDRWWTAHRPTARIDRPNIISSAVAMQRYSVSRSTLARAVRGGRLTDHRASVHAKNTRYRLDEREVAKEWEKKMGS